MIPDRPDRPLSDEYGATIRASFVTHRDPRATRGMAAVRRGRPRRSGRGLGQGLGELLARVDAELAVGAGQVQLDRAPGEEEGLGDLGVRAAVDARAGRREAAVR